MCREILSGCRTCVIKCRPGVCARRAHEEGLAESVSRFQDTKSRASWMTGAGVPRRGHARRRLAGGHDGTCLACGAEILAIAESEMRHHMTADTSNTWCSVERDAMPESGDASSTVLCAGITRQRAAALGAMPRPCCGAGHWRSGTGFNSRTSLYRRLSARSERRSQRNRTSV